MTRAVYAGSFNPWHKGHQYIYDTAVKLFDTVDLIKAINPNKTNTNVIESKIPIHCELLPGIALGTFCQQINADVLVRGVRVASDYDYEFRLATFNQEKFGLKTVFIPCTPSLTHVSSSALREFHALNIDISEYLI